MIVDHMNEVNQVYNSGPAEKTIAGALVFLLRVLTALPPEEKAGLLRKTGDNVADYKGESVSVSRVCYPDGQLYKVLTDVPTTNGPSWQDNGVVDTSLYFAVDGGGVIDPPKPCDLAPILKAIDVLRDICERNYLAVNTKIDNIAVAQTTRHAELLQGQDDIKKRLAETKAALKPAPNYVGRIFGVGITLTPDPK